MSQSDGIRVIFAGRVQGVGFRYTVQRLALDLGLRGWVRNLPDGRVEAEFFGDMGRIRSALKKIQKSRGPTLRSVVESSPRTADEADFFEIRLF